MMSDAHRLWNMCAALLRAQVSDPVWHTAFEGVRAVDFDGRALTLGVSSPLAKERIEGRYLGLVRDALTEAGAPARRAAAAHRAARAALPVDRADAHRRRRGRPRPGGPAGNGGPRRRTGPRADGDDPDRPGPAGRRRAEPPLHVRELRHRRVEPLRPRRRPVGGRDAGPALEPAVHLRRRRPRQDPPAAGHRQLRERQLPGLPGALRHVRDVPQRVHRLDAVGQPRRVQAPLPRHRRAAGRRRAVLRGQAGDARGVLPHLQPPAPDQPADRAVVRPGARPDRLRGPPAQPVPAGPDHRHPAARARDPPGHPPQEGRARDRPHPARRARVHRHQHQGQHPGARGGAHPGVGVRQPHPRAASPSTGPTQVLADLLSENQPRPITPAAHPRRDRRSSSASPSRTCRASTGSARWSPPARSPCTSCAS